MTGSSEILYINGKEVEAIVSERREDDEYVYTRYRIPSWKNGDREYETEFYVERKGVFDTSVIESMTGMPKSCSGKMLADFEWGMYPEDTTGQQNIVNDFLFNLDVMIRECVGLYIKSKTRGSGKTFLACCVGNEIIRRRGINVKFVSVTQYIQEYLNKTSRIYSEATVLILDDIGVQDDSKDWISEILYGLVNYRYERRLLTIFTSNIPIAKCSKDERIVSRVEDMSMEMSIPEVPVRSRRAQRRKEKLFESLQVSPFESN